MTLEIPPGSNYEVATRAMRRRERHEARIRGVTAVLFALFIGGLCTLIPGILYWLFEVVGSIMLDALVYVIIPFFLFGVIIAFFQNWAAIWRAIGKAFKDMIEMLLMR